ncbi:MAG: dihydroorotate dehydrogenase electron transfer subunit [Lachnospiraceae bacterium]|nr:dihydroorotate dehydrogenase electron transfer subunit [Lachnospiraceae bacterium]MDE7239251.1 dihydroorotate dehydrogenase electron transfer subunit [Lachnospiraceae bacterium]
MNKKKETAVVSGQRQIAEGIYDMWIKTNLAVAAKPGQFLMVYPRGAATLLPRPISICEVRHDENRLRIVYRVAGKGTAEFASYREGEPISVMGTLGNGFPLEDAAGKRVFLMGGGIGIPPMLGLAQALAESGQAESTDAAKESGQAESTDAAKESGQAAADSTDTKKTDGLTEPVSVHAVLGYRDSALFLKEEFERMANVVVATEDGSVGTKGNIMDAVRENTLTADVIYACGPMPMLRAVKQYASEAGIPAYISLEERMACGVGACLGCVCKTKQVDAHSHVKNARVCTEGPVFLAEDVEI